MRVELQPAWELENLLVERISLAWRRRLRRVEAGIFSSERYE